MASDAGNTTLSVQTNIGVCDYPCCSKWRPWVSREDGDTTSVRGLQEVLDSIDRILSETTVAPLLGLLFLIIGIVGTVLFATNGYGFEYIIIAWIPSNLLNFVDLYNFINRYKRLSKTIDDWNRETGLSQGVSLKVGLNHNITTYLKFAYLVVNCNCGCSKSNIKLCRHNPTSQV